MILNAPNRCGVCGADVVIKKVGCYICASCRTVQPYCKHGVDDAVVMNEEFDTKGVDLIMKGLGW